MRLRVLGALALSLTLAAPPVLFAQDRGDQDDSPDDEKSVIDNVRKELEKLPERLRDALSDVKKEIDPEKAAEVKRRLERVLDDIRAALDPRGEKVRVHVGDRTMEVPERKGSARLY